MLVQEKNPIDLKKKLQPGVPLFPADGGIGPINPDNFNRVGNPGERIGLHYRSHYEVDHLDVLTRISSVSLPSEAHAVDLDLITWVASPCTNHYHHITAEVDVRCWRWVIQS